MDVSLMITCLGDVLQPQVGRATVGLLRRLGHSVRFPEAQTCCGQPFFNSGFSDHARAQARHTIETFAGAGTVVVPSGSCAAMVKTEYPRLLEHDPNWHARAQELAARTYELGEFLVNVLAVTDVGAACRATVTYHYACHLRGLGLTDEHRRLIEAVRGVHYVPLARQDQCCGFGGSFSVRYPEISCAMVDDKVRAIAETGADTLISTDAGCLMNIGGRLRRLKRPVRCWHLAELLMAQEDLAA